MCLRVRVAPVCVCVCTYLSKALAKRYCAPLAHPAPVMAHIWVKSQIVPPVNIRFNPTTKIGLKIGGKFTYQPTMGSHHGFDNHSHLIAKQKQAIVFFVTACFPLPPPATSTSWSSPSCALHMFAACQSASFLQNNQTYQTFSIAASSKSKHAVRRHSHLGD